MARRVERPNECTPRALMAHCGWPRVLVLSPSRASFVGLVALLPRACASVRHCRELMSSAFRLDSLPILNIDQNAIRDLHISLEYDITNRRRLSLANAHRGLPLIFKIWQRVAFACWNSVRILCRDDQVDLTLGVAVPGIARGIADLIYSHVYLYDDLSVRADDFFHAGIAKLASLDVGLRARHGGDPAWAQYLADHAREVQLMAAELSISIPTGPQQLKLLKQQSMRWPNPGGMKRAVRDPDRKRFLEYLDDWYYATLSQDTHGQMPGTVRLAAFTLDQMSIDVQKKWRSDYAVKTYVLLLAFLSELAAATSGHASLRRACSELWATVGAVFGMADELRRERYAAIL